MVLALVAGIAAMHTLLDVPMAASVHSAAMHSPGLELAADASPAAASMVTATDSASSESLMNSMSHAAMHACLFLVVAAAALLLLLLPRLGDRRPVSAPKITLSRRPHLAMPGIDRTLVLQVLRI
jgi:hypothetical protein